LSWEDESKGDVLLHESKKGVVSADEWGVSGLILDDVVEWVI